MRVAFAGTPPFARAALQRLHEGGHPIVLVLTQPDRPAGRGMAPSASAVKACAAEHGFPVAQPAGLRLDGRHAADAAAAREQLVAAAPQVLVVAAYGLILPAWVLELPPLGCLNIHASLLPRWRGAAPVQRAIEAGDRQTGITIMQMDAGLDTGDMLLVESIDIASGDTAATLTDRLAELGGRLIVSALDQAARGALQPRPQDDAHANYARKIDKAEAPIDWSRPAAEIERRLRAFDPFPGCTTSIAGQVAKVWRGELRAGSAPPGTVLAAHDGELVVACGEGALALTQLQRPGGRRLDARQFLASGALQTGDRLGPA